MQMAMVIVARWASEAGWSGLDSMPGGGFSAGVNVESGADAVEAIAEPQAKPFAPDCGS